MAIQTSESAVADPMREREQDLDNGCIVNEYSDQKSDRRTV
jgi:hypothetical protein